VWVSDECKFFRIHKILYKPNLTLWLSNAKTLL